MFRNRILWAILLIGAVTSVWAASGDDRIEALENQVKALQAQLEAQQQFLEKNFGDLSKSLATRFAALEKKIEESANSGAERENRANAMLTQVNQLIQAGQYDQAKAKMAELKTKYAGTTAMRRAGSIDRELSVIGKDSPADLGVEKWYQGNVNHNDGEATLIVFWEVWCPHCKREVPKLEQLYSNYKDKGLQVIGLTRITKSATEESVLSFMQENNVTYPVAKENGSASSYFGVSGIPAAAVVKDGKIVWRGHPARLSPKMLDSWL